ncbi:MAG: hypothetical protein KC425_27130 [Anaerolineales bacterium]|nr:hypothetical protein [Anaerolineales bacterium]
MRLLSPLAPTNRRRQWLGFIASPVVWTVYFVTVYVLDEAACKLTLLAPTAVFPITSLLTLLTLGIIAYAGALAYRAWREGDDEGSGRFLGWAGLLLCALFALVTVATWGAAWVLMPC